MLKVGLTGSIAVGKSFVLEVFCDLGCHVLDADKTAREVVELGTVGLARIVEEFGNRILASDGSLDRKKLGDIVFQSEEKRALLNSIVHPLIFEKQNEWLAECERRDPEGIAIVEAALMIESGGYKRFERLIVVWCEPDIQLARLMERDGLSQKDARSRIALQMQQSEKKSYADYLINTSRGTEGTLAKIRETYSILLHLKRLGI
jgi:dephospho-CoA kinase